METEENISSSDELLKSLNFTPASVIGCYQNALKPDIEKYPITVRGIYKPSKTGKPYNECYYDKLTDENEKEKLDVLIRIKDRVLLKEMADKVVTVTGILSRRVRSDGQIIITLKALSFGEQEDPEIIPEKERIFYELVRKKTYAGKQDVRHILNEKLKSNSKPKVALVWASGSTTKEEFENAKGQAKDNYIMYDYRISFSESNMSEAIKKLADLDNEHYDAIAIVGGGGAWLNALNNNELLSLIVDAHTPIISAAGHAVDQHNLKILADLVIDTPTALGKFFYDLVEDIKRDTVNKEMKRVYDERIASLKEQLKSLMEDKSTKIQIEKIEKAHRKQTLITSIVTAIIGFLLALLTC